MVTDDKQYEFVSKQVRYHNEKIIGAFKLFIQLFSAIIGGTIWLSLQPHITATRALSYAHISDILVTVLALFSSLWVFENLRAWHGYRGAQHRLGGLDAHGKPKIPAPRLLRASVSEAAMILIIAAATFLFWRFNPFTL
jgi:hypothetical protein